MRYRSSRDNILDSFLEEVFLHREIHVGIFGVDVLENRLHRDVVQIRPLEQTRNDRLQFCQISKEEWSVKINATTSGFRRLA